LFIIYIFYILRLQYSLYDVYGKVKTEEVLY